MISRSKVQMFSYDQLFQAYQKDKFVLVRPGLQGGRVTLLHARVTLARGLKDSPSLQAKFTGRVTLLPETTLRFLRFGNLASKAQTDNKTGK